MGSHQTLIHKSLMLPMAAALTEANAPHESWYSIKAAGRGVAEVLLYDEIGVWGITALQFARDLKAMGDLTKINLHIHSPGGDVFEGTAIYNLLRNHPASVDVYIDGLAASMASVIAMAGDTIYMPENAMMMVHKPWGIQGGDADDMRRYAELLDKVEDTLVMAYANKTGKSADDIKALLKEETWMNGREAVAAGFADQLTEPLQAAAHLSSKRMQEFAHMPEALKTLLAPRAQTPAAPALLEQSTKNLNDALSRQADVRKEFADLVKGIQATPTSGTQTFGDATAAQASARNALTAGNNQKAIEEARRALQILQQLKDAGANSYGFEGVAKEVERIANKAAEVEAGNAKAADDVNRLNLADLEERIKAVQNVEVSFGMDFESAETLKQQVADIAAGLAEQLVIPITLVPPPEMGLPGVPSITPKIPGFATGTQSAPPGMAWVGERGPELMMMRGGERIFNAVQSLQMSQRYQRTLPEIPEIPTAALQQANPPAAMQNLGSLTLNLGGDDAGFTVFGTHDTLRDIRKAASKFGRTRPK
ncbi:head maturation protease, ClpP-related [Pseudomonas aeruginosa]